jgi:hypothetical protein
MTPTPISASENSLFAVRVVPPTCVITPNRALKRKKREFLKINLDLAIKTLESV